MKLPLTTLLAATSLLSLCGTVSADTIISDSFTGTDGTTLGPDSNRLTTNEHSPDVNLTGNPYTYDNQYNTNPVTVEGNQASISAGAGASAAINITSSSAPGYVKPTILTISAALEPNNIATGNSFDKEGLGFYSAPQAGQSFEGFLGLALSSDGTLSLIGFDTDDFSSPVDETQAYTLGTFNPLSFHTVTYTVDTLTGAISGATLTDGNGTETYNFTTSLFTNTATTYAGFYARSDNDPGTAYVDNFTVSGPVAAPEPTTTALMAAGLAGLVLLVRNRRTRFALRG